MRGGRLVPTPGGDEVAIRPGTVADAGVSARLHASQIDEGFLAHLGPRFLRHLYRRVALSPSSFLLVAVRNGHVVGFLAGSMDLKDLYKQFALRDGIVAGVTSAPRLIMSWRRVLETLRHGSSKKDQNSQVSELLSVAVDPDCRGLGIGRLLVKEFLAETSRRNCGVAQVVVGRDNSRAVSLYEGAGFKTVEEFEMHPGTVSLLMESSGGKAEGP
jgi:ribosomal protein S18 acetylase RimI-like enzyme